MTGDITVTKAVNPLLITADNQNRLYGADNPTLTVTYSGFVNGDDASKLTTQPTIGTTATSSSPVGAYDITASGAVDNNYTITYATGTLTVNQVNLTIAGVPQTKDYGAAMPTLTAEYSGFVNGDTEASLTTKPTVATTATAASPVGTYPITVSAAASPNYNITYFNGNLLTIKSVGLTAIADNQSKNYGDPLPSPLTVHYTGLVNGDLAPATPAIATTTATQSSPAGSYDIVPSGADDPNYTISYTNGTLTVNTVALTVKADNQSKYYGQVNPPLTITYNGFTNGDDASKLSPMPTISTTAATTSLPGPYPITVGGAGSNNYTFNYQNGTLTVNPVGITFNPIPTQVYGNADLNPGATTEIPASITYTSDNTAVATIVNGKIHIVSTGTANIKADDGSATATQLLTVTPAALTITADSKSKTYGAANPALTISYNGFANGDTQASFTTAPTIGTTATTSSAAGSIL